MIMPCKQRRHFQLVLKYWRCWQMKTITTLKAPTTKTNPTPFPFNIHSHRLPCRISNHHIDNKDLVLTSHVRISL